MPVVKTKAEKPQQPKTSGKGLTKAKSRRSRKNKNSYTLQYTKTEFNKKKKLGAYIRNFPSDLQAIRVYEKKYGDGTTKGLLASLTRNGEKLWMRDLVKLTR